MTRWPEAVLHPVLFDLSPARSGRSRTPLPPVTWSTGMMGECDDEDLPRAFQNDDIKRKALEAQTFHTARPGRQGYGPQRDEAFLENVERRIDRALKFCAKSGTLSLVPRR